MERLEFDVQVGVVDEGRSESKGKKSDKRKSAQRQSSFESHP